jgi:hypothetical protein
LSPEIISPGFFCELQVIRAYGEDDKQKDQAMNRLDIKKGEMSIKTKH